MSRLPEQRPTLHEVARLAGVSTATVSRVLNSSPRVTDSTRAAVKSAVAQLGYVPNPAARSLIRRQSDTIALVVSETEQRVFADPFFPAVVHGIAEAIAATDLQLVLLLAHGERQQRKVERYVREGHVDGVLLTSLHGDDAFPRRLARGRVPVVLAGRPRPGTRLAFVDADNRGGARAATEHLLAAGRRTIATVTGPLDMAVAVDRFDGYRDALAAAGVPFRKGLVAHADFTAEGGEAAARALLQRRPGLDAIFVASDLMALGVLRVLEREGRAVPGDVAVVGFDDTVAAGASPPLTTVRQPLEALARAVVEVLLRRIEEPGAPPEHIVLPTTLVQRASA